jgi:hypothetical protein
VGAEEDQAARAELIDDSVDEGLESGLSTSHGSSADVDRKRGRGAFYVP